MPAFSSPKENEQPSLFKRMVAVMAAVSAVIALIAVISVSLLYRSSTADEMGLMLENECLLVKSTLRNNSEDTMKLASLTLGDTRCTLIAPDGSVLYDSQANIDDLPNQSEFQEVVSAVDTGSGSSERPNEAGAGTLIYKAVRLDNGNILRLAAEKEDTSATTATQNLLLVLIGAFVVLLSFFVVRLVAIKLMEPIFDAEDGVFDETPMYYELSSLTAPAQPAQSIVHRDLLGGSEQVDLHQVALAVAKRVRPRAKEQGIKFVCSGSAALTLGTPAMLDKLMYNLVDNAVRYTSEGGKVRLWTGVKDGVAVLSVEDSGAGIPADIIAQIFETSYQGGVQAPTSGTSVTGVGLSVANQIAQAHDAQINVESTPGEGTLITVVFPLASADEGA